MTSTPGTEPLLKVQDVEKWYGGLHVLRGISFEQSEGEAIVIVGSSGSGKSTLLRCLAGLEDVDRGTILFRNHEISASRKSVKDNRGEIGMLFQSFNLFPHLTVLENITLAPRLVRNEPVERANERANTLLGKVGLSDKVHSYPYELSGGQSQRVAIARALAMEPKLMLFDEPTSALDPELTREVLDVMLALVEDGMTVTIVTHEMGFARKAADRMVFMENGRIVEAGRTEEMFESPRHERTRAFLTQLSA